jgi:NADH:ubiquinone oxidoreductase subunit B-like Fe-S oxidoreductase
MALQLYVSFDTSYRVHPLFWESYFIACCFTVLKQYIKCRFSGHIWGVYIMCSGYDND